MEQIHNLFYGFPEFWGGGVAHSVLILSLVISIGLYLGKIKVANISLGLTWVLFIGLVFGHFCLNLDEHLLHFLKEFGLILFVYSIGLQVGPGFFSSFRKGGARLNVFATTTIALSIIVSLVIFYLTGTPATTMAGILTGAVTNTPGLGAAQQANSDLNGVDSPEIALGYVVTYPIGVLGVICAFILLKYILRINTVKEEEEAKRGLGMMEELSVRSFSILVINKNIEGKTLHELKDIAARDFVVSRILPAGSDVHTVIVNGKTTFHQGDRILVISNPKDMEPITVLFGVPTEVDWQKCDNRMIVRRMIVTQPEINGKTLSQLKIRSHFGANITRVNRADVDLVAAPYLNLQLGDKVTVVGTELAVSQTEKVLGNSMKRLNYPNLIPIFLGIALGCILANMPIIIPGIPQYLKLGLTGGPLIAAILIGYIGPKHRLITYNTISANLMLREIGFCIFLACVGLGLGKEFMNIVISQGGLTWIGYGVLITILPILIGGIIGRTVFHLNYYTMIGVLAGTNTNPVALSYANDQTGSDSPSVGYATVYPFAMFLRILSIQIFVLVLG
ncbi:MAG: putative transporter [Bacteroidaceae bacterium]|nr:putative transporter [Bacteroidaceae bacterium]